MRKNWDTLWQEVQKMKKNRFKYTAISILIGLIVGAIILGVSGFNPFEAYWIMITGVFGSSKYISWTIIRSTSVIITGISVAFAFRTGLFNIGAEGQFIIGAMAATLVGYFWHLPPIVHVIVAFSAACIAAAIWGGIAGAIKSKFGINEVITSIMLNWIALYLNNYVIFWDKFKRPNSEASYKILESAQSSILTNWKLTEAGRTWISNHPLIGGFIDPPINIGFIVAILLAFLINYILNNTTLGYQLRAVGFNKDASEYGGINVNRNIVMAMMISGAISGAAGALHVLGVSNEISVLAAMEGNGFNGMAVSLIAGNNPIGCIFAGLLFGGLTYGGHKLQPIMGAPSEVINIMIGTIVFFIAMPKFVQMIVDRKGNFKIVKRGEKVESDK